ncbi:SWIM zinc finger family protein [Streptomyces sp. NPDC093094]|uniref:SWIM zinc finger family protein n=1 Tax=Streptomyces sp. NPDC093094 TaxID=3366026 RepID=UPI0037FD08E6
MTQQEVRWTADQVLALAPDVASREAGSRLGAAGPWSGAGSSGEGAVWGLFKGGGSGPYRTAADLADVSGPAYTCSCPSRRSPCRHALGLLLLWADGGGGVVSRGPAPEWVEEWREGRRARAGRKAASGRSGPEGGPSDPEAARRRAERRAERITAGVTELEQRLMDLLRGGLASVERTGDGLWEEIAARMVDAQAPGLAARARESGATVPSGADWPSRLLEECALLHLLGQGWLHRERLPPALAAAVRSRVGLPTAPEGPPLRDDWLVLAQYDTQDPKLTTRRTWLHGSGSGRTALVLSYGAAGRAPELTLPVGLALDAEVSAYPGGLRGVLGERFGPPAPAVTRPPGVPVTRAVALYGEALRDDPWLESVPVTLERVVPVPDGDSWHLADAAEDAALPLTPAARARPGLWRLVSLAGGAPVKVFGECGHRGFNPLAAWPQGAGGAVALC